MWRNILAVAGGLTVFALVGGILGAVRMALHESYGVAEDSHLMGMAHCGLSMLCSGFIIGLASTRKHVITSLIVFTALIAAWGILLFAAFPQLWELASADEKQLLMLGAYYIVGLLFLATGAWLGVRVRYRVTSRKG